MYLGKKTKKEKQSKKKGTGTTTKRKGLPRAAGAPPRLIACPPSRVVGALFEALTRQPLLDFGSLGRSLAAGNAADCGLWEQVVSTSCKHKVSLSFKPCAVYCFLFVFCFVYCLFYCFCFVFLFFLGGLFFWFVFCLFLFHSFNYFWISNEWRSLGVISLWPLAHGPMKKGLKTITILCHLPYSCYLGNMFFFF